MGRAWARLYFWVMKLDLPSPTRDLLARLPLPSPTYLAGGTIRDLLLGRRVRDIDLTVPRGAISLAQEVAQKLNGVFVLLDETEGVARVVKGGLVLDFSDFREGSQSIEEDLRRRDFTINAMACEVRRLLASRALIIDPTCGLTDLARKTIRATSKEALKRDPLRLLRAHRLAAELSFRIEPKTLEAISSLRKTLRQVAAERVIYELNLIFETPRAAQTVIELRKDGLFEVIFPELLDGAGIEQPPFHHLDVLEHSLESLNMMEAVLEAPERYFSRLHPAFPSREESDRQRLLKLAALFHDVGKPKTLAYKGRRPTFYNHDRVGAELFFLWAKRWRMNLKEAEVVANLIRLHMRPFYLLRDFKAQSLTGRAKRRLLKETGKSYPDLFLVAMADSLASAGPAKPKDAEQTLAALFWELDRFYHQQVEPVIRAPRLITGDDLIVEFGLTPGPIFRRLLEAVEEAAILGEIKDRHEALSLVAQILRQEGLNAGWSKEAGRT